MYIYIYVLYICCVSNGKMKCGSALLAFWTSVLSRCLEPILCHGDPFWTLGGVVCFWCGVLFRSCSCCCNCWRGQGVACLINAVIISAMFVVTLGFAVVLILLLVVLVEIVLRVLIHVGMQEVFVVSWCWWWWLWLSWIGGDDMAMVLVWWEPSLIASQEA